jgi:hypothetical protein
MRSSRLALALAIFIVLALALAACVQPPPAPEEPAGGPGIVRDLNVPGTLTARMAVIRDALTVNGGASVGTLAVRNELSLPDDTLTVGTVNTTDLTADTANVVTLTVNTVNVDYLHADGLSADVLIAELAAISDTLLVSNVIVFGDMDVQGRVYHRSNYYPLTMAGSATSSALITTPVSLVRVPMDVTLGDISFFAREISGTVRCGVYQQALTLPFTVTQVISPVQAITFAQVIYEPTVIDATLDAGQLVFFGCSTGVGGYANDVTTVIWFQ